MRFRLLAPQEALILAVLCATGPVIVAALARPPHPGLPRGQARVRGIALSLYYPEDRERVLESLDKIAALGATHVSLPIPVEQRTVNSRGLMKSSAMALDDSLLAQVCAAARQRSLAVVFFPLVHLKESGPGKWRGTIQPPDWSAWFRSYEARMLHYAELAQASGAEWLCVGAELNSSEAHAREWVRLLVRVRRVYSGRIFYSQNWDYPRRLAFSGRLDQVGFNAYFGLSPETSPTVEALERRWQELRGPLLARARSYGHPLLLTEVGYPSSECAATRPWDYLGPGSYRPELQALCFESFFRAWDRQDGFQGAFVYLWSARRARGDRGYSLRGKPAQGVVTAWYRRGFPESSPGVRLENGMGARVSALPLEGAATGPDPRYSGAKACR